jgi:hypothetical protein
LSPPLSADRGGFLSCHLLSNLNAQYLDMLYFRF